MKNLFKVRHIVSIVLNIIMVTALATCVFAGCTKESSPSVDSSKATSSSQSSVEEKSQESPSSVVESSVESVDNSVTETSVESKEEKSVEVSEEESSEVVSESESSSEISSESSVKSSDISLSESSVDSSVESSSDSDAESSVEESSERSELRIEDAIRYGKVINPANIHTPDNSISCDMREGWYIAIFSINNDQTYSFLNLGTIFEINQSDVELFPEDYVPSPTDPMLK